MSEIKNINEITEAYSDPGKHPRLVSDEEKQANKHLNRTTIAFIIILFFLKALPFLFLIEIALIITIGIFAKRIKMRGKEILSIVLFLIFILEFYVIIFH